MTLTYRAARFTAWLAFKLFGHTEVIGHRNLPGEGGVIVASNHVSYLDPPLVGSNIMRECAFMARHDLWHQPILGWLISRLNAFPVHRDSADRKALRTAVEVLRQGKVLVLFPEGTRSLDGRLQRAQPGLALIVQLSTAPVVPCAVVGPEVMWPPGRRFPRPAKLKIVFGSPVFFSDDATREEIVDTTMGCIAGLLQIYRPDLPVGDQYKPLFLA